MARASLPELLPLAARAITTRARRYTLGGNSTDPPNNNRAARLDGPSAACVAREHESPWRMILLGVPGAGKATQVLLLGQRLAACHLFTGDLFGAAGNRPQQVQTPALRSAIECMRPCELVPALTAWEMVGERSQCLGCRGGFLLDGFERTLVQADAMRGRR